MSSRSQNQMRSTRSCGRSELFIETKFKQFQIEYVIHSRNPASMKLKHNATQNGYEQADQRIYTGLFG